MNLRLPEAGLNLLVAYLLGIKLVCLGSSRRVLVCAGFLKNKTCSSAFHNPLLYLGKCGPCVISKCTITIFRHTLTAFLLSRNPLASTDFENIGHRWIGTRMQNIFATNLICSSTVVWQPGQFQWKLLFRYVGTKCGRKRSLGINHESQFLPSLQPPPHPIN